MNILHPIDENAMIACFLQAEIGSKRFQKYIQDHMLKNKVHPDIISKPDLHNTEENAARYAILSEYRGYGTRTNLFEKFPLDVDWYEIELMREEVLTVKYINYDYWNELSNNTRLPLEAAKTISSGKTIFDQSNDNFLEAAEALQNGAEFPKLIVVTDNIDGYLVAMEGNLRLTAYALKPEKVPAKINAIMGVSPEMHSWGLY